MFDCVCYITTVKDCNLDQAMEDAIIVNAHDVEEVLENDQSLFMVWKINLNFFFMEYVTLLFSIVLV